MLKNLSKSNKRKTKIVGFQSGHDASYCILENGIPILHEEMERITRRKMQRGDGLKFFLSRVSKHDDIQYFTFGNWGGRSGAYAQQYSSFDKKSDNQMKRIVKNNNGGFFEFGHHTCHAANAFYSSNFSRSLIITMDGAGWEEGHIKTALTVNEGVDNKIVRIKLFRQQEVNLGEMYHKATALIFNLSIRDPRGDQSGVVMAMGTLGKTKYTNMFSDFNSNWQQLASIAHISEQEKFNVAASLQEYTEQTFRKCVSEYINQSACENLCLSGGVSLNCVMLGKIRSWFPKIKNIFCDPVPYDSGLSLGSARYLWHHILENPRVTNNVKNQSPYLGRKYSSKEVIEACRRFPEQIRLSKATDEFVLEKINNQKIVSLFGGGSESGRRALGNRSIVADPRNAKMKKIINEKIKHRQWFRPLAPSILEEKAHEWFVNPSPSPYMSFALKFKEDMKDQVPSVVHFDGTGRLQTVNKLMNPWYHRFISNWEKLSGIPILINTSFNDDEPIVETPLDALSCFNRTELDYLYFFDYGILVEKLK